MINIDYLEIQYFKSNSHKRQVIIQRISGGTFGYEKGLRIFNFGLVIRFKIEKFTLIKI